MLLLGSFAGPFILRFHSDDTIKTLDGDEATTPAQAQLIVEDNRENGFRLTYWVTPDCPS